MDSTESHRNKPIRTGWSHWESDGSLTVDRPGFRLRPEGWIGNVSNTYYRTWEAAQASGETVFRAVYSEGPNED